MDSRLARSLCVTYRSVIQIVVLVFIAGACAACDLATKSWATASLSRSVTVHRRQACERFDTGGSVQSDRASTPPRVVVPDVFELTYTENCNGAFGVLHQLARPIRRVLLILGNLAVSALLFIFAARARTSHRTLISLAVGVLVGGAMGNAIDRFTKGYVVDFIHLYWRPYIDWPVFNVADILIGVGIGLLALATWTPSPPAVARAQTI